MTRGPAFRGASPSEAALHAWKTCQSEGYVMDQDQMMSSLPKVAPRCLSSQTLPRMYPEVFTQQCEGEACLFLKLLKPKNNQVHFLYFWKAFRDIARLAGTPAVGEPMEGVGAEVEALRDGVLRRLDAGEHEEMLETEFTPGRGLPKLLAPRDPRDLELHPPRSSSPSSASDSPPSETSPLPLEVPQQLSLPIWALVDEVHRAASMSLEPHFWQAAASRLVSGLEPQDARLELPEITKLLVGWLRDATAWQKTNRGSPQLSEEHDGDRGLRSSPFGGVSGRALCHPVRLHIYDVTRKEKVAQLNQLLMHHEALPVKLGSVFHAGVEVNGLEWSYGSSVEEGRSGVRCNAPREHARHHYRETVELQPTPLSPDAIANVLSQLVEEYPAEAYDSLSRNCCHFAEEFCARLGNGGLPAWVHRLAKMAASAEAVVDLAKEAQATWDAISLPGINRSFCPTPPRSPRDMCFGHSGEPWSNEVAEGNAGMGPAWWPEATRPLDTPLADHEEPVWDDRPSTLEALSMGPPATDEADLLELRGAGDTETAAAAEDTELFSGGQSAEIELSSSQGRLLEVPGSGHIAADPFA